MDRRVKVRRPPHQPFSAVYVDPPPGVDLEKLRPTLYLSRIWLGAVPEQVEREAGQDKVHPAYACVLGEIWDTDPMKRDQARILLDEASALNPAHFSDQECEQFRITEKEYKFPTIASLRYAMVCLKDLWWPSLVVVPPEPSFYEAMLPHRTDALIDYRPYISDGQYERMYPFFKSRERTANEGIYKVETENIPYNTGLINAAYGQDLLTTVPENTQFPVAATPPAFRCVGMLINEMQRRVENNFVRQRVVDPLDDAAQEELFEERNSVFQHEEELRHLFQGPID